MTKVRVISYQGNAALVEWHDGERVKRAVLPSAAVPRKGGLVDDGELARGIPYGLPFAELITPGVTAQDIEDRLHKVGIWTKEDLFNNPQAAQGAIMAAYGIDFSTLLRAVKEAR